MKRTALILATLSMAACATAPSGNAAERGLVSLSCLVGTDQRLVNCRVVRERPLGKGFGAAALRRVREMRVSVPARAEVGSRIDFSIKVDLEDGSNVP